MTHDSDVTDIAYHAGTKLGISYIY